MTDRESLAIKRLLTALVLATEALKDDAPAIVRQTGREAATTAQEVLREAGRWPDDLQS